MGYYTGRVAAITGAGSGIGRALAVELARRGAYLALMDRDDRTLADTAGQCRSAGTRVLTDTVDVTDQNALERCSAAVSDEFGRTDLVWAGAGVIHTGSLLTSDHADISRVISINLLGVVNTVTAFLPRVIPGGGHVVTCSSGFGLVAAPHYSAYCASKFAVRGFAEALRQEMALDGHPVSVTCVYPGAVSTPIVRRGTFAPDQDAAAVAAGFDKIARTTPARAAAVILRGVPQGKAQVFVGADARAAALLPRAAGSAYLRLIPWIARRMKQDSPRPRPSATSAARFR